MQLMKLSKKEAIKLHRKMWTDMQERLGNKTSEHRALFKDHWCHEHFPNINIKHNCLLCQYAIQTALKQLDENDDGWDLNYCQFCPIDWPHEDCVEEYFCEKGDITWDYSDISDILALPERK